MSVALAAIVGCGGPTLTAPERALFARHRPLGFILFARNLVHPEQVRGLCAALRESVGRADAPILIDQEGGRVARLRPPRWRLPPPAALLGALATRDHEAALAATRLNGRLIAAELADLGIDVDCAPVLDVPVPGAHDIIGDRAFASDPLRVAELGRAMAEGLMAGGVLPVMKHLPGHGRARADSHAELPVVEADLATLDAWDFAPFRALSWLPMAMTAHVVYPAIDALAPATCSRRVVAEIIRGRIGFDGLLLSDDVCMGALSGPLHERAAAALAAGCDVVLHCSGDSEEMAALLPTLPGLDAAAARRLAAAQALMAARRDGGLDLLAASQQLDALLGQPQAAAG